MRPGEGQTARTGDTVSEGGRPHRALLGGTAVIVLLVIIKLSIHLLTVGNYGYFRDELYYVEAGKHLALGYVDFPPFVALVAALTHRLFGDSLLALHLFPALAGAAVVALSGLMARELGGGRFAQGLAALSVLVAPDFLVFGTWLSMDAFDQLWWVLASYVLLLVLKRDRPRLWLLFGLVAGLGLLTKLTILFFGLAVFVALLLTSARRHLLSVWPWVGGAVALIFLLPYIWWNASHGWPTLEFWADYGEKVPETSPAGFLLQQVLTMNPGTLPIWFAGLYYYLFSAAGKPSRPLGWLYVVLLALFVALDAKFYFLAPAYPALFAAGAVVIERLFRRRRWNWPKPAYVCALLLSGLVIAPLTVVPALPVETLARITGAMGGDVGVKQENRQVGQLPQNFADRFGWQSMVASVAGVYHGLPQTESSTACVLAGNYGEAGAIDFFGPKYGLPKAISGHNSYYLWGPRGCSGETVVSVGVPRQRLEVVFGRIERADTLTCRYCMPDENDLPVYVCRNPKEPFEEAWPRFKHYD